MTAAGRPFARVTRLVWQDPPLAELAMPRGTMRLTRSLTSGLSRCEDDPEDTFWGVGDRGPNIKPAAAAARYGLDALTAHAATDGAKVMPLPGTGPALARFRIEGDAVMLEAIEPLRTPAGNTLTGLPLPLPAQESEPAIALNGSLLGCDPDGADSEGLACRSDGRIWIAEEYGPSLLLVTRDGLVERRHVPAGTARHFKAAGTPIVESLPMLALSRKLNRGFEALALSADQSVLFTMFQSPLSHPDRAAHAESDLVRMWLLDAEDAVLLAEYAYPLDPPENFRRDMAAGPVHRTDIKVSELAACGDGSLLVLERVALSTHIYRVRPEPALRLAETWAEPAHRPTLEQLGSAGARRTKVPLLAKQLIFSSDDHPEVGGDLEGMIVLNPNELLLASDSDYGTEGAETGFWRIAFPDGTFSG